MRLAGRDPHLEHRAVGGAALRRRFAAVQVRELLDQCEADACTLVRARPRLADAMEALEEPRQLVLRNADAGVAYRERDLVVALAQADRDLAVERELEGVRQQVK